MKKQKLAVSMLVAGGLLSPLAYATNGMNLEGYGPEAAAMGGASMAYDNGTAATMNNPATLGLMKEGARFDLAVGGLFPAVTSKMNSMPNAESSAKAFYMPAMGYANKSGALTWGVGVFSQGGMGTEYAANSFMSAGSGKVTRSEVGVGRFIVPVAYQMDDLTIGGSIDYVWAGMDLQMAMDAGTLGGMVSANLVSASGSAAAALPGFVSTSTNVAYFNFSDNNAFTGQARGSGFAGKLGLTYRLGDSLTIGAAYHSRTKLSDLSASGATMEMITSSGTNSFTGEVKVINFQWPETYGIGMAYQASDSLMVVADYKRIAWSQVMSAFKMNFVAGDGSLTMDMTMPQDWADQNVYEIGAAFKASDAFTLRGGVNLANNPVPDAKMHPLFPAIAKSHVTAGFGYAFSKASSIDMSFVYVPQVSATNDMGITVDFGGYSSQFLYSYRY